MWSMNSITHTMKRKFSLGSLRLVGLFPPVLAHTLNNKILSYWTSSRGVIILISIQKASSTQPEESKTPEDLESPPYSPTPSECERPRIPLNILLELKQSCAILVNDTNPPTDEYENVPDPREALRKYEQAQAAKRKAKERAEAREAAKAEQQSRETSEQARQSTSYKHVPKNAATSFKSTAIPRRPSHNYRRDSAVLKPTESGHTQPSANARAAEEEQEDSLFQIRAALESRPKTSAAACIDYSGPSEDTSASTSRSQTTDYSHAKRPISTSLTSINTPGEDKRLSFTNQRISEQILQDGASASLADATAKAWMMQELARRRAEAKTGPARPASRASAKPASESDRPRSRAGSLAGSVLEGVRDYVRPRASMDSLRSSRSDSGLSITQSRSSSIKGRDSRSGWRAQLRRRGSFSSWRNTKPHQDEATSPQAGAPNLNRELPALPGLDQYKEKKPKPAHIAQIMRAPRQKKSKDAAFQQHYAPPPIAAPLSPEEEQRRLYEIRRAVEEKTRIRPNMPPSQNSSSQPRPNQRPVTVGGPSPVVMQNSSHPALKDHGGFPECPRTQSQPVVSTVNTTPNAMVQELEKQGAANVKKASLRKRLSRFWSAGGGKNGAGAPGKMVAAN